MLNQDKLADNFKEIFHDLFCPVFETALLEFIPTESKDGNEKSAQFRECLEENLCEPLAKALASAIDMYIRQMDVHGMIITTGSSFTQTAKINSSSPPMINGVLPNTLGIS